MRTLWGRSAGWAIAVTLASCSDSAGPPQGGGGAAAHDPGGGHGGAGGPATSGGGGSGVEPLSGLPPAESVVGETFQSNQTCEMCHAAGSGVLRDDQGRDVSPTRLYASSMMSLSARDPYWLAAISREVEVNPAAETYVEDVCTRCHAPAGARELEAQGATLTLDHVLTGTSTESHLAREGVACTVCHQISAEGLGEVATFDGAFEVGAERQIFGPHAQPFAMPMMQHVQYTPVEAPHMLESKLCASCHTVITSAVDDSGLPTGPEVNEQVTFLEWRNSAFAGAGGITCQGCHLPTTDQDGAPITTKLSLMPQNGNIAPRAPIGRHLLSGGNAYMLELMAANASWVGLPSAAAMLEGAAVARATLGDAASLVVSDVTGAGGDLSFDVTVTNGTGHKLPTGYPGRRMWLHVVVRDGAGGVLFESGSTDARGALLDGSGERLDPPEVVLPHLDVVTSEDEVQVWESVLADESGAPTHVLLDAWGFAKDDRLLPAGWSPTHADAGRTSAVGVGDDPSFLPGSDRVTFVLAGLATAASVEVELLFESVPPAALDAFAAGPDTPAGLAFLHMAEGTPPAPIVMAASQASVP